MKDRIIFGVQIFCICIAVLIFGFLCLYVFTYGAIFNGNANFNIFIGNVSLIIVAIILLSFLIWDIKRRKRLKKIAKDNPKDVSTLE